MIGKRTAPLFVLMFFVGSGVWGQTPSPSNSQPHAPGLRKLTGDDENRARQLDEQIKKATRADRWPEAIKAAEELSDLRVRRQGGEHFEAVNAAWQVKTLRRIATLPKDDRVAFLSADEMNEQGDSLHEKRRYAEAQPLLEKVLEIRRRLLTDDHPLTAVSCGKLAANFGALGRYAAAQPLLKRALEIHRRLLTDDHPDTAQSYNNLATNLMGQGKYAAARPLFEQALAIRRRLLT